MHSGTCTQNCPATTFADSSVTPSACSACGSFCSTCTSNTVCDVCISGYRVVSNVCQQIVTTSPSTKFLEAATVTLTVPTTAWTQINATVTLSKNLQSATKANVLLTLNTFKMTISNGQIHFDAAVNNQSATGFNVGLSTRNSGSIQQVDARYVTLTDNYAADNVNLIINTITLTNVVVSSSSSFTHAITINTYNNNGSAISTYVSISGMDAPTASGSITGLDIGTALTASGQTFTFTITSNLATTLTYTSIKLLYVIFNAGKFNDPTFASWVSGVISGSATASGTRRLLQSPMVLTDTKINAATTLIGNSAFGTPSGI